MKLWREICNLIMIDGNVVALISIMISTKDQQRSKRLEHHYNLSKYSQHTGWGKRTFTVVYVKQSFMLVLFIN